MGNNEITPLLPDSLLGEFMKANESRISETSFEGVNTHAFSFSDVVHACIAGTAVRTADVLNEHNINYTICQELTRVASA